MMTSWGRDVSQLQPPRRPVTTRGPIFQELILGRGQWWIGFLSCDSQSEAPVHICHRSPPFSHFCSFFDTFLPIFTISSEILQCWNVGLSFVTVGNLSRFSSFIFQWFDMNYSGDTWSREAAVVGHLSARWRGRHMKLGTGKIRNNGHQTTWKWLD